MRIATARGGQLHRRVRFNCGPVVSRGDRLLGRNGLLQGRIGLCIRRRRISRFSCFRRGVGFDSRAEIQRIGERWRDVSGGEQRGIDRGERIPERDAIGERAGVDDVGINAVERLAGPAGEYSQPCPSPSISFTVALFRPVTVISRALSQSGRTATPSSETGNVLCQIRLMPPSWAALATMVTARLLMV